MKYRVEFNPEARADLLGLYDYIAEQGGEGRALAYITRIEEACLTLETFPLRGKLLDAIRPGLRVLGFERRVSIAFQVNPQVVTIFRVLYGGRELNRALEQGSKMQFLEHVPLAPYTTFKIGGPARWFAEAATESDILEAMEFARSHGLPLFPLGGGSNLLVADAGFPGLVLRIGLKGIGQEEETFTIAAGEEWDGFVSYAVERDFAGIECLAGIPGTAGGTPIQNVGAYGQEVSETVVSVRALNLSTLRFEEFSNADCGFAYRRSIFNSTQRGKYIVTRVSYKLRKNGEPKIAYADLKRCFQSSAAPSLREVSEAVRAIRRGKGMYIVAGDPDCRSAGSFFKNPIVSEELYARIAAHEAVEVPHYPAGENAVKIPAAWLLERAGFHKGYTLGEAGISTRHTLALVNRGSAKAADIFALRDKIIATVDSRFGIRLEPEPVLLG